MPFSAKALRSSECEIYIVRRDVDGVNGRAAILISYTTLPRALLLHSFRFSCHFHIIVLWQFSYAVHCLFCDAEGSPSTYYVLAAISSPTSVVKSQHLTLECVKQIAGIPSAFWVVLKTILSLTTTYIAHTHLLELHSLERGFIKSETITTLNGIWYFIYYSPSWLECMLAIWGWGGGSFSLSRLPFRLLFVCLPLQTSYNDMTETTVKKCAQWGDVKEPSVS